VGSSGRPARRRLIRIEFITGAVACSALGIAAIATVQSSLGLALGVWLLGAGANYVPLVLHAESLAAPGRLRAEIRVLVCRDLQRAAIDQLWIAVPFALALSALSRPAPGRR
jgi:hypothetical protein